MNPGHLPDQLGKAKKGFKYRQADRQGEKGHLRQGRRQGSWGKRGEQVAVTEDGGREAKKPKDAEKRGKRKHERRKKRTKLGRAKRTSRKKRAAKRTKTLN